MFKSPILFVVGAGASAEVGLPVGSELRSKIESILSFDRMSAYAKGSSYQIRSALEYNIMHYTDQAKDVNTYLKAAYDISKAMPIDISIDDFINAQSGDKAIELVGKLAITKCILEAEKSSLLINDTSKEIIFSNLDKTWYNSFWRILIDGTGLSDLDKLFNNVSFIIFNYDRCIEHYLVNAVSTRYRVSKDGASELVSKLQVYHPYGTVGKVDGLRKENPVVAFGEEFNDSPRLLEVAKQIKTYTEQVEDKTEINNMQQLIESAETIVFLGFAFHQQNLNPDSSDT
jgi:hypothetical protein